MYICKLRYGPLKVVDVVKAVDSDNQKTCDSRLTIVSHIYTQQEPANSMNTHWSAFSGRIMEQQDSLRPVYAVHL